MAVNNCGGRTLIKKAKVSVLWRNLRTTKVQRDVNQLVKVTTVASSAVIGKNDYEALVGGGTKCSKR